MCRIYAGTDPSDYAPLTRSVRLHGAVTSIRLEARFWAIVDEMAAREGMATPQFLGRLHDEVLELHGEVRNFASLLRLACAIYLEQRAQEWAGKAPRRPETADDEPERAAPDRLHWPL